MPTLSAFLDIPTPLTSDNNTIPTHLATMATAISDAFQYGTFAGRPATASGKKGNRYYATDRAREWIYIGTSGSGVWTPLGDPPGSIATLLYFNGTTTPVIPTGYIALDGHTDTGTQTAYPDLWAILPTVVKSGANFVTPDLRATVLVGADNFGNAGGVGARASISGLDPSEVTGANQAVISIGELPLHAHVMSHGHGLSITADGGHFHELGQTGGTNGLAQLVQRWLSGATDMQGASAGAGGPRLLTYPVVDHSHAGSAVTSFSGSTNNNGNSDPKSNVQLSYAVLLCIRT